MSVTAPADLGELDLGLQARLEQILSAEGVPGAAIAVVRGDQHFAETFGVKRNGESQAVEHGTAFDIGSCSKSFVATAVAALIDERKLEWNQPVHEIVPELELYDPWVTRQLCVEDLLTNRVGLVRQLPLESFANAEISLIEILGRLRHTPPAGPFRATYAYFNPGFMTLALIVSRRSGMPYARFLEERLFTPLGMSNTASGTRAFELLEDRASPHVELDGRFLPTEVPVYESYQGAAGVYSSASDAARWIDFQLARGRCGTESLVSESTLSRLHEPHTVIPRGVRGLIHAPPRASFCAYGMGFWTCDFHGRRLVQHAGEMMGWRSHIAFLPGERMGVSVFISCVRPLHAALSYWILESLLGSSARDWVTLARDDERQSAMEQAQVFEQLVPCRPIPSTLSLEHYAGHFTHPGAGGIVIERSDHGSLLLKMIDGRLWDSNLRHVGENVFEVHPISKLAADYLPAAPRIRFETEGGRATRLFDAYLQPFERVD